MVEGPVESLPAKFEDNVCEWDVHGVSDSDKKYVSCVYANKFLKEL